MILPSCLFSGIAEGFFFDGCEAAAMFPSWVAIREVAGFVALDDFLIGAEDLHEFAADFFCGGAAGADDFSAGELEVSPKQVVAPKDKLVDQVAPWDGAEAGGGVALAALCGDESSSMEQDRAASRWPLDKFARLREALAMVVMSIAFDREAGYRLACFCDASTMRRSSPARCL